MNEKFMKVLKFAIPTLTVIIIASQLFGAPATSQKETLDLIQKNEMIEIEIAVPKDEEQGTVKPLEWTILAELTTYQDTLRTPFEKTFNVRIDSTTGEKIGSPYFTADNQVVQNNTFVDACQNDLFRQMFKREELRQALSDAACNTYADLEADDVMTNFYMAINGYFNLLPDATPNYANPSSTLTRAEFLALLTRASTPVKELELNKEFESLVGKSDYTIFAQESEKFGYLNSSDKSINEKTYVGTISRAEAVYTLVSKYYADELANANMDDYKIFLDLNGVSLKDGGDIATEQGFADKTYSKSYELVWALNNPDEGLPTPLYRALVIAISHGMIESDAAENWDEGITKAGAIELLFNTVTGTSIEYEVPGTQTPDTETPGTNNEDNSNEWGGGIEGIGENPVHPAYRSEYGTFDIGLDEAGLTREEDAADGFLGYQQVIHEDGTSHLVCNLDGSIYYHGDELPSGGRYIGTKADREKSEKEAADLLQQITDQLKEKESQKDDNN